MECSCEIIWIASSISKSDILLKKPTADILKWITSKDLLYSTGNSAQCYVAAWMRGEFGGEWWWFSCKVVSDSWDPLDCSLPGSSVQGIFQARILDWVAISFSRGSSWPRDWTCFSCVAEAFLTTWSPSGEFGGEWIHAYLWLSPLAMHLNLSQHS